MKKIISNAYKTIFSPRFFVVLLILYVIVFIVSTINRYIYIDDAWHAEQAYWFAKCGFNKAPSILDFAGWENRLFVYHKLNIIAGALIIKLFGWSYYYFKIFTFIVYFCFFIVFKNYFKFRNDLYSNQHFYTSAILLIISPMFIYLSFTYRPEFLVMFFGFGSFFFIEKALKTENRITVILSGLFTGLAFLSHVNGIIFVVAGFLLLLINKRFKLLLFYSIGAFVGCMLYTFDLWQGDHFQQFLYQLKTWPYDVRGNYMNTQKSSFIFRMLEKLSTEHQRFFWSEKVSFFSLLFFISLIAYFKRLWHKHRNLLLYLFMLIILLNLLGSHIAERYTIYYSPFMAMIIAFALVELYNEKRLVLKSVMILLFVIQIFLSGLFFYKIISKRDNYVNQHHELISHIPDTSKRVMVPYEFIFNEIDKINFISNKTLEYYTVNFPTEQWQDLFIPKCRKLNIRYLVLEKDPNNSPWFPWLPNGQIKPSEFYKVIYRDQHYIIVEFTDEKLLSGIDQSIK